MLREGPWGVQLLDAPSLFWATKKRRWDASLFSTGEREGVWHPMGCEEFLR